MERRSRQAPIAGTARQIRQEGNRAHLGVPETLPSRLRQGGQLYVHAR